MAETLVSVIVPTRNGARTIVRCIESLMALVHPSYEVIVVDDGSTDETPALLRQLQSAHPGLIILRREGGGPSAARNAALATARGEYIAFTDDDCIVRPDWLNALLKIFDADERIAGVGGAQQVPDDETAFGRRVAGFLGFAGIVAEYVKNGVGDGIKVSHNASCCVMYRRNILVNAGGFDETLWPGEDVELDYRLIRAGYELRYVSRAAVAHYRPRNMVSFARMMYRYGAVQALLVRRYGPFRALHYEPVVLAGMLAAVAAAALLGGPAAVTAILITPVAALLTYTAAKSGPAGFLWNLLFGAVTGIVWNTGFMAGMITPAGRAILKKI